MNQDMNPTIARAFLWSGVLVICALIVAQGFMMGFIPGLSPGMPASAVKQYFIDHGTIIEAGCLIQCIVWSFWNTWAIAVTMLIRKMERGAPILTYASIANVGGGYVFFILIPMTWAVIAFRARVLDATIVQVMNDWVWFDWLFTWPPFALWMVIIGVAVLQDHNLPRVFPRWVAFYNFWSALLIFPAGLIAFFKTGPFAYDGFISFWFAVAVFFGWMVTMTIVSFRAVRSAELQEQQTAHGSLLRQAGGR